MKMNNVERKLTYYTERLLMTDTEPNCIFLSVSVWLGAAAFKCKVVHSHFYMYSCTLEVISFAYLKEIIKYSYLYKTRPN